MIHLPSNVGDLRAAWRAWNALQGRDVSRETPCFRMVDGDRPKLYVYDVIGGWDSDSEEFVKAVHGLTADAVDLHINSPGGFVYDAVAMYDALESSPATVHAHVDGLAASAASFLLMAGDHRDAARGARGMIHDAQIVAWGSPADLREAADLGDAVSNDIARYYAARAGGKATAWRAAMTATTWYSAQQMKDAGLVETVRGDGTENSGASNRSRLIKARAAVALGGVK